MPRLGIHPFRLFQLKESAPRRMEPYMTVQLPFFAWGSSDTSDNITTYETDLTLRSGIRFHLNNRWALWAETGAYEQNYEKQEDLKTTGGVLFMLP
ncbi:MAG: hypothetical protein ACQEQV_11010 [Fibrobacterota bacterium]